MPEVAFGAKTESRNDYKNLSYVQYSDLVRFDDSGNLLASDDLPLRITIMPRDMRMDILFDADAGAQAQQIRNLATAQYGLEAELTSGFNDPDLDTETFPQLMIRGSKSNVAQMKAFLSSDEVAALMPEEARTILSRRLQEVEPDAPGAVARLKEQRRASGGAERGA